VCSTCGERYYPGPLLEKLDEVAQHAAQGARTVKALAFDYTEVG